MMSALEETQAIRTPLACAAAAGGALPPARVSSSAAPEPQPPVRLGPSKGHGGHGDDDEGPSRAALNLWSDWEWVE